MKILYISHKIPYPLSDGGRLRVFNHIKHLSEKHKVISLSFIQKKDELKNIDELRKYCEVKTVLLPKYKSLLNSFFGLFSKKPLRVSYLKNKRFRKIARKLTNKVDLVIIQALRMEQYCFAHKKTIIDIVDTPSLQIKRALKHESWLWKKIWKIEFPRIIRYEQYINKRYMNILVASRADMKALKKGIILKNGTKIGKIKRKDPHENNLMFLGNMEYHPNIDAVNHFIKDIFPLIKKKIKDAKFYIVGKNPGAVKRYASKDIIITGFVDDLNEYFSRCRVFVAPLRLGSGIQNKVLEALNHEIPVITTSIVNDGVEALKDKQMMIADNAKDFADKTIKMLQIQSLRESLGYNGKELLKKNYSWEKIYKRLDRIIFNL